MASPKSPIQLLASTLGATPALKGFARVLAGKNFLALERSPPSIVLFPIEAGYQVAADRVAAFVDVDLAVAAHLWGRDLDEAWDLRARYVAALHQQAFGNGLDDTNATPLQAGFFVTFESESWDTSTDSAQQGQELTVVITMRASASDKPLSQGTVSATSTERAQTIVIAMSAGDVVATVDSTYTQPTSGVLHIDSEQMSYSGITPTSFTGLTRGINGTVVAAHLVGATAYVSPT